MSDFGIQKIAVLGAGTMGSSIAQFFAEKGCQVSLYSRTEGTLSRALERIRGNMELLTQIGLASAEKAEEIPSRIQTFTCLEDAVQGADWVLESVSEDREVKKKVIEAADHAAPKHSYLTSDTSALNIFEFLETDRQDRLFITHFFNPAHLMPLVEMIPGPETSEEALQGLKGFLEEFGKSPIVLRECIPGFVANRLTLALAREAYYLAEKGYASMEDIDRVIKTTFGPRYVFEGIFDLYDHIGLDVGCAVAKDLLPHLCNSTEVPKILQEKVKAGDLGIKTGRGLKDYRGRDIDEICRVRNQNIAKTLQYIQTDL